MDPVSWLVIGLLAAGAIFGAGTATGAALKGDGGAKAIEAVEGLQIANGQAFDAITSHIDTLAESDALTADRLTATPAPCLLQLGGDPMSPQCMAALCMRTGESDKQRCTSLDDLLELSADRWRAELVSCPDLVEVP